MAFLRAIPALPRFSLIVLLLAAWSVLTTGLSEFADDPGVGWHLASGEYILQHGKVPDTDPFLHAAGERLWVSDQWLSDLLIAVCYRLGSFPYVYAVLIAIYLFVFFGIVGKALQTGRFPAVSSVCAVFLAFKIAQIHLLLRPVVFGFFCFSLLFVAVLPFYQSAKQSLKNHTYEMQAKRFYLFLPILFFLWANLHPSFMLGLVFLVLVWLGFFLETFFPSGEYSTEEIFTRKSQLLTVIPLCLLTTLCNPYGYALHQSIIALGSSTFFMNYHQEWLSPNFVATEGVLFEFIMGMTLLTIFLRSRLTRVSLVDLVLICSFIHFSFDAVRFLPFLGIVLSPYVAQSFIFISQLADSFPGVATIRSALAAVEQREVRAWWPIRVTGFVSLIIILATILQGRIPFHQGEVGPSRSKYPYQEIAALSAGTAPVILAAEPAFGGFITWYGQTRVRALIDDRNTLLGEQFYKDFERNLSGIQGWQEYFKSLGATHILLRKSDALASELTGRMGIVPQVSGDFALVFKL